MVTQGAARLPMKPWLLGGCLRCGGALYWRDVPMGNEFHGRELVCLACSRIAKYEGQAAYHYVRPVWSRSGRRLAGR